MSFYASQVGKKSSRYCNSSLYGTNLSSVYADGPPPLDDSTQDEDDDEMVFRDPSPSYLISKNDHKEKGKETDFKTWPNGDANEQSSSSNDFGDFSSFADFSSAFGTKNESNTDDNSWFNSNGNTNQSGGTLTSENEIKSKDFSNSDDEFGCFSGGDESDFDDFKGFSNFNKNTDTSKTNSNVKSINGVEVAHQSGGLQTVSKESNVKRSDFFSDDDDEFDDLQSSNQIDISNQQTNNVQNIPNSIESQAIPSIFSDDDDDFGEFSSSSGDVALSVDKAHIDAGHSLRKDINSSNSIGSNTDSSIGTFVSKGDVSIQQKDEDNGSCALQGSNTSNISESLSGISKESRQQNHVKNIDNSSTEIDIIKHLSPEQSSSLDASREQIVDDGDDDDDNSRNLTTSIVRESTEAKDDDDDNNGFSNLETKASIPADDDGDDFGDFSAASKLNAEKNTREEYNNRKLEMKSIQNEDDGDFGEFSAVSESNIDKNIDESFEKLESSSSLPKKNCDEDFGGFPSTSESNTLENNVGDDDFGDFSNISSHEQTKDFNNPSSNTVMNSLSQQDDDDDFGGFAAVPSTCQSNGKTAHTQKSTSDNGAREDFGSFSTASQSDGQNIAVSDDDNFGDFAEVSSTIKPSASVDDEDFGDFASLPESHHQNAEHGHDDGFGAFSSVSSDSKNKDSQDNDENFSQFATFPQKTLADNDDDFGDFGDFSYKAKDNNDDESADDFGDFSTSSFSTVKPTSPSMTTLSRSTTQNKGNQIASSESDKMSAIFQPVKNLSIDRLCNTFQQSFVKVELAVQRNIIVVMLKNEIQAGTSSIWQNVKRSEKDGSLRFEWLTSDHQVKMLEALSMLPVRIQTSASFKPSGPVQTPLFASGLGLLEPVKGVITPFHHGVEEINPSQDPFGAPPEVGVPDLGFGGVAGKKEWPTVIGHPEVKDSMDTISVSSSLDLDFLAPSNSNGDSAKTGTEGRVLYEDDLLGLGMKFSPTNDSPKVLSDQKKIFKCNATTIVNDDKNLSTAAKKIVADFEDLSFMLSKALMFPLKSKE